MFRSACIQESGALMAPEMRSRSDKSKVSLDTKVSANPQLAVDRTF
jgi:hypothetical protein